MDDYTIIGPDEVIAVGVDFTEALPTGVTIESAQVTSRESVTVSSVTRSDAAITAAVSGVGLGAIERVSFEATLTNGEVISKDKVLRGARR